MLHCNNLLLLIIVLFSFTAQGMISLDATQEINSAARDGDIATLTKLIEKHSKQIDQKTLTLALWHALDADQFESAEFLLTKGAQVNSFPNERQKTLYEYFSTNKFQLKQAIWLLQHGADPDLCSYNCATPLASLCLDHELKYFHKMAFKEMQLLCSHGANPNAPITLSTCLEKLIRQSKKVKNKITMIVLLVKAGADINAKNIRGETSLHWAVLKMPVIVPYLLNRRARKDITDHHGRKAIDFAEGQPELYVMLASDKMPPIPQEALEAERELNKLKVKLA
jgi:ankyrin repeat protein